MRLLILALLASANAYADPVCTGGDIELTAIVRSGSCPKVEAAAAPEGAWQITVDAPKQMKAGAEALATVTVTNTTAEPQTLDVKVEIFGGGLLSLDAPKQKGPEPLHLVQRIKDASTGKTFEPTWLVMGMRPRIASVQIAAHGHATLRVQLLARGFLPGKDYGTSNSLTDAPDALPPGRYDVTLELPITTTDARSVTLPLVVAAKSTSRPSAH